MQPTPERGPALPNTDVPTLGPRSDELSDQPRTAQAEIGQIRLQPTPEQEPTLPNTDLHPLDPRFDEFSEQLRTAQAEIGQIRLQHQEEKKPWWQQTAVIISIIGLLLSSGFSVYTALDQIRQRKATALDTHLADIVALRMEDARQSAALASTNLTAYRTWNSVVVVKRAMLVDALLAAVHDLQDDISPTAALAVGYELIQDGRYLEAEKIVTSD